MIALDGPGGSGKSTVAAALAAALDVPHVDTGAYYRAVTLAVRHAGVDPTDADACAAVAAQVRIERRGGRTYLDDADVEEAIRGPDVTAAVSSVAAHPAVRERMVVAQRREVGDAGAVVEGRDAGTVVVPHAHLKVWLTASREERAARRAAQLGEDDPGTIAAIAADLARRDTADSPQMAQAADAVIVDSTGRTVEEVVAELAERSRQAVGERR